MLITCPVIATGGPRLVTGIGGRGGGVEVVHRCTGIEGHRLMEEVSEEVSEVDSGVLGLVNS